MGIFTISSRQRDDINRSIQTGLLSGACHISLKSETLVSTATGCADRANKRPNTPDTLFGIASGTKFFTALAIMRLREEGMVALDTDIRDLIPITFKQCRKPVTIHHLLSHTSGVPDYFDEDIVPDNSSFFVKIPWYQLTRPLDYLPLHDGEPMKFQPGDRFCYSNGGYILLGAAVETITGRLFREFVGQEILAQCGTWRTGFYFMNNLPADVAYGYIGDEHDFTTNIYNLPIVGASDGGMFATVREIDQLWRKFIDGEIVNRQTLSLMKAAHALVDESRGKQYGYGLWMRRTTDYQELSIVGDDAGVSFFSSLNEAEDLRITIVSNCSDGIWDVLKKLYQIVYP